MHKTLQTSIEHLKGSNGKGDGGVCKFLERVFYNVARLKIICDINQPIDCKVRVKICNSKSTLNNGLIIYNLPQQGVAPISKEMGISRKLICGCA